MRALRYEASRAANLVAEARQGYTALALSSPSTSTQFNSATPLYHRAIHTSCPTFNNDNDANEGGVKQWPKWLKMLQKYVAEKGQVPTKAAEQRERKLQEWLVDQQRRAQQSNHQRNVSNALNNQQQSSSPSSSSSSRIVQLEHIPGWAAHTTNAWTGWYDLLLKFVHRKHRLPEPEDIFGGFPLGRWCDMQRLHYKQGALSAEYILRLEGISSWYWERYDSPAAHFVKEQRRASKAEAIPDFYWTWDFEGQWEAQLHNVQEFVGAHSRLPTRHDEPRVKKLSLWCEAQCRAKKEGNLSQERIEELEIIPVWRWEQVDGGNGNGDLKEWFDTLQEFMNRHMSGGGGTGGGKDSTMPPTR